MLNLKLETKLIIWTDFGCMLKQNLNEHMTVISNPWTNIWIRFLGLQDYCEKENPEPEATIGM